MQTEITLRICLDLYYFKALTVVELYLIQARKTLFQQS